MRLFTSGRKFSGMVAVVVAAALWAAPEAARPRGSLVVAMAEPFTIQGRTFHGGRLTLRDVGDYSPSMTRHEVGVDGGTLGVLMAHRSTSETEQPTGAAVFRRDAKGRLHLVGYACAGRDAFCFLPEPAEAAGERVLIARRSG